MVPGPRLGISLIAVMSLASAVALWGFGLVVVPSEGWGVGDGVRGCPKERDACFQAAYLFSKSWA